MTTPAYPERIQLARLPTPLEHFAATSEVLGVEFYLKRDDMTGVALTGNKVRKLEFLLADANAAGADTVITCGGAQSNHCRATALASARLGLRTVLFLRTEDPAHPPAESGNILLDRLAGADIVWLSYQEYARRDEILAREAERLRQAGQRPYVIPEGGSNAVGTWGYIRAAQELAADLAALRPRTTTIVYPAGSGGTGAGLVIGAQLFDFAEKDIRIAGINVCDDRDYFVSTIHRICAEVDARYNMRLGISRDQIEIIDGYVGRGYAKSQPAELEVLRDMVRRDAVVFDPVYTGKAFYGLCCELKRNPTRFGDRIVFLHTGGIFGLFPAAAELVPLL